MLAIIYDVHGNLPALEAVLADASQAGAARFVLGGDYALFGPWPAETVERLRELDATWIRGNGERWTASPSEAPDDEVVQGAISASRAELGDALVVELGALPEQHIVAGVRYCHGSPPSDVRSFFPEPADDEEELLSGVHEERVVFGHTHRPFSESLNGTLFFNPGYAGKPRFGMERSVALLHLDEKGIRPEYFKL